ncbi:hypothetical protein [Stieleria varia]|uniref:Uncharacterized protein n=1 Tax=Stieleria varia TaxID=2528005 RepID=A0A5C6B4B6_9BACT|nr:hypothetical protein [Stieleria varia]TWU06402.1 hypothetical protein Pla52n_21230 [Stieleria varia]
MNLQTLRALCLPLGAVLACLFAFPIPIQTMESLAVMLVPGGVPRLPSTYLIGCIGLLLLGAAVVDSTLSHDLRRSRSKMLLLIAAAGFALASLTMGKGGFDLHAAFTRLATAETVEGTVLLADLERAKPPFWTGWISILAASVVLCISRIAGQSSSESAIPPAHNHLGVVAATTGFLVSLCAAFITHRALEGLSDCYRSARSVEPSLIASYINQIVFVAVLLSALSYLLMSIAMIVTGLASEKTKTNA